MTNLLEALKGRRFKLIAIVLIASLMAPPPAPAQFLIDLAAIVGTINAIGSAISDVIAPALRAINSALGTLQSVLTAIQNFFQSVVYPQDAINRARGLVGAIQGLYAQIQVLSRMNVASATLALPRQLEQILLSRSPLNIPVVTVNFQSLYQTVPIAGNASPQTRDMIDITDATAQAAMKRSLAIDAIADIEMQAADRINQELEQAAPGTAPMIEAEAAAWLVRANAYTQSALGDLMRVRAIALANGNAQLKINASQSADTRRNVIDAVK
jgi:hypothetical protein